MLGQMRSRNRVISPPCPCNNTCRCHIKSKRMTSFEKKIIFVPILIFVLLESYAIYYSIKHPRKGPEYIEVNGKMCEIGYHNDCSAPMSCGHKIAVCKE